MIDKLTSMAVEYSAAKTSLVLKLQPTVFTQMGADLRWISCFPHEHEVLYGPLTYLQPTGRVKHVSLPGGLNTTVVEVVPHL